MSESSLPTEPGRRPGATFGPELGEAGPGPGDALGDFVVRRRLAHGGMGIVYEAEQRSVPGRMVAVKLLRDVLPTDRSLRRFQREIETIGRLDHPSVVPVVAAGVHGGMPFYAMKLLEGLPLSEVIDGLKKRREVPTEAAVVRSLLSRRIHGRDRTPMDTSRSTESGRTVYLEGSYVRWATRLVLDVAEGLQHAHEHGIVHRDIKPENIIVSANGRGVVIDFGLAVRDQDEGMTMTGDFVGTLAYASPEQARGQTVDIRSDVFSLGATLYELLSLRRPFDGPDRSSLIRAIESESPVDLDRRCPRDVRTIVTTALAKSTRRRYQLPSNLADDLRSFLEGRPIVARPPGLWQKGRHWLRRHPRLAASVLIGLAILVILRGSDHWRASRFAARGRAALEEATRWEPERYETSRRIAELENPGATDVGAHGYRDRARERARLRTQVALWDEKIEASRAQAERWFQGARSLVRSHPEAARGLALIHGARLRESLEVYGDILSPQEVWRWEAQLALYAQPDDQRWLVTTGSVEISSDPPGASLQVFDQAGVEFAKGTAPLQLTDVPEGSYRAVVCAAGRDAVGVPFIVRRVAVQELVGASARVDVEAPPVTGGDGFVWVPGGWGLLGSPLRWRHVDSFFMQRYEVTYEAWVDFLNSPDRGHSSAMARELMPRYSDRPGDEHVEEVAGRYRLRPPTDPRWPVRGLSPEAMRQYAWVLHRRSPPAPGWYYDLPQEDEWERAARGVDGRLYPWGQEFDWDLCAGYFSGDSGREEPWPVAVGTFAGDVSVFGIHDMAGSVREATRSPAGPVRELRIFRGGSYRSTQPSEMTTTVRWAERNEPRVDGGFRLVQRRFPTWMTRAPESLPFVDDFDRDPGPTVGNGWAELQGRPLAIPADASNPERCTLEGGRLVVDGGVGNFSNASQAWRRIVLSDEGFTVTIQFDVSQRGSGAARGASLALASGFLPEDEHLGVFVDVQGRVGLAHYGRKTTRSQTGEKLFTPGSPHSLELRVERGRSTVRVWRVGDPRPPSPQAEIATSRAKPLGFLGLTSGNNVGVQLVVDEIKVEEFSQAGTD